MNKVGRFLGEEAAEYLVVGLMMLKPEIDSFSGSIIYNIDCKLGDAKNPIDFLSFFEKAQQVRQLKLS
ncbi:hypothetical protein ACFPOG_30645 [Paenibacillus aestuarii]|uniref:Uncharacterized protein n=1 Tax=Paenibacillus aestuarii TaxID=516965 RepID=A0ABW0KIM1_9BACL